MLDFLWIPPGTLETNWQLGFLTLAYSVVLYKSSCLIADGSELLLLVPSLAGLVGSIVLPILGAVPDGMMTLFSGLGEHPEKEVSVGVGVLAGSTVMLLTFPWFIAVIVGRTPIVDGKAKYGNKAGDHNQLFGMGITFDKIVKKNAIVMLVTTASYLIIQIPAAILEDENKSKEVQIEDEFPYAAVGLCLSIVLFFAYLVFCFMDATEDKEVAAIVKGIENGTISLHGALNFARSTATGGAMDELIPKDQARLRSIVRPFFTRFDQDRNGTLHILEFQLLLRELGEASDPLRAQWYWDQTDKDKNGTVNFDEFSEMLYKFLSDPSTRRSTTHGVVPALSEFLEDEDDEEVPEDLASLDKDTQQKRIKIRSAWMMGVGTVTVILFSDPMVDVLNEWGNRMKINPFYVSFIVAPLASNASELLAAYTYAAKKSQKAITTSISTLVGAACMNNTFCLAIFFSLICGKGLAWQFKAETTAIVLVQWIIGILAIQSQTHSVARGAVIFSMYFFCLLLVYVTEAPWGLNWD